MVVFRIGILALAAAGTLAAERLTGIVTSGGLPVPGTSVTASRADQKLVTATDDNGSYV